MVVDPDLLVQLWNPGADDLWGLRFDEVVRKNLLNIDIGLPVERLKPLLKDCLSGEGGSWQVVLEATDRHGRAILCRVTGTPIADAGHVAGVILVMGDDAPATEGAEGAGEHSGHARSD